MPGRRNRFIHREGFPYVCGVHKKEDYDLDKVFRVEKWVFTADAACSFGVGANRLPGTVEAILLAVFGATLFIHVYVFKSRKFRSHE